MARSGGVPGHSRGYTARCLRRSSPPPIFRRRRRRAATASVAAPSNPSCRLPARMRGAGRIDFDAAAAIIEQKGNGAAHPGRGDAPAVAVAAVAAQAIPDAGGLGHRRDQSILAHRAALHLDHAHGQRTHPAGRGVFNLPFPADRLHTGEEEREGKGRRENAALHAMLPEDRIDVVASPDQGQSSTHGRRRSAALDRSRCASGRRTYPAAPANRSRGFRPAVPLSGPPAAPVAAPRQRRRPVPFAPAASRGHAVQCADRPATAGRRGRDCSCPLGPFLIGHQPAEAGQRHQAFAPMIHPRLRTVRAAAGKTAQAKSGLQTGRHNAAGPPQERPPDCRPRCRRRDPPAPWDRNARERPGPRFQSRRQRKQIKIKDRLAAQDFAANLLLAGRLRDSRRPGRRFAQAVAASVFPACGLRDRPERRPPRPGAGRRPRRRGS